MSLTESVRLKFKLILEACTHRRPLHLPSVGAVCLVGWGGRPGVGGHGVQVWGAVRVCVGGVARGCVRSISNIAPFASRSMSLKSCVHRLGGGGAQSRPKSRPNSTEALPKCCASAVQALCKRCASCVQAGPVCMQATLLRMSPVWRSPHFVFLKVRASIPLYNIKRTEAEKEG